MKPERLVFWYVTEAGDNGPRNRHEPGMASREDAEEICQYLNSCNPGKLFVATRQVHERWHPGFTMPSSSGRSWETSLT